MNCKKLLFPLILIAFVAFQSLSSPLVKYGWMPRIEYPQIDIDDDEEDDGFYDPRLLIPDSVLRTWPSDSLLFYADSLMHVYQIDSAELERIDYEEPDIPEEIKTLVDSVFRDRFVRDSTLQARIEFEAWFDSLPKREKKKWILEHVTIPAQKRKLDSMMHVKDSIVAYKDSVTQNTPRVLQTPFIPDSMRYKRILLLTNDKRFGDFKIHEIDTTFNYHFYDYPFLREDVNATWLGTAGGPVQLYDVSKRKEEENAIFFTPLRTWTYDANSIPTYNTKTPHTELGYWGTPFSSTNMEELNVRLMSTQNITPKLNLTLELNKYGTGGKMTNQKTSFYHFGLNTNYLGERYSMNAGYQYDGLTAQENGGYVRPSDIRDTTLKSREIEVNLSKANSKVGRHMAFLNHSLRIPLGKDSTKATTAFVGHTTEWNMFTRTYDDDISNSYGRAFYNDVFLLNPNRSADSLKVMRLDNRFYIRLQPWKEDFFISKVDVGVGDKLLMYKDRIRLEGEEKATKFKNSFENDIYAYAGLRGNVKKYFNWNANAQLFFAGKHAGDFNVDADMAFHFYPFRRHKDSPISLGVNFHTDLTAPDHYEQDILLNHFEWHNDFAKRSLTRVGGSLKIPHWKLGLDVNYTIAANSIYYDGKGIVQQSASPVNILSASLNKEFVIWWLHLDNRILAQMSSNQNVVPVPTLALNLRWFLQFYAVKNVLQVQLGANGFFSTKWAMPGYNPELGVFYNQDKDMIGMCPVFDVFLNLQWKRACIFVKVENIGEGGPLKKGKDYFTAAHYIHTQRNVKFGIFWPFYIRQGKAGHSHNHGGGGNGAAGGNSGIRTGGASGGSRGISPSGTGQLLR